MQVTSVDLAMEPWSYEVNVGVRNHLSIQPWSHLSHGQPWVATVNHGVQEIYVVCSSCLFSHGAMELRSQRWQSDNPCLFSYGATLAMGSHREPQLAMECKKYPMQVTPVYRATGPALIVRQPLSIQPRSHLSHGQPGIGTVSHGVQEISVVGNSCIFSQLWYSDNPCLFSHTAMEL